MRTETVHGSLRASEIRASSARFFDDCHSQSSTAVYARLNGIVAKTGSGNGALIATCPRTTNHDSRKKRDGQLSAGADFWNKTARSNLSQEGETATQRLRVATQSGTSTFRGVTGFARPHQNFQTYVPYNGYFVQATYFLTGEELIRRVNVVKPRRDFRLARGKFGPGAIEIHARYSTFNIGKEIFTGGFADPNLWSNHAWATDIGLNWYLNYYTKFFLDWQHSEFGDPVVIAPNKFGPTRDLFWLRFQVFF